MKAAQCLASRTNFCVSVVAVNCTIQIENYGPDLVLLGSLLTLLVIPAHK